MRQLTRAVPFLIAALAMPGSAPAQEDRVPSLTVAGRGIVAAAPDMATLRLGVVVEAAAADAATAAMSEAMTPVLGALEDVGIAGSDVRTGQISLRAIYTDPSGDPGGRPRIAGYEAVNEVEVRIRALDRLGEIVAAAVTDGANRFDGLNFGLQEPDAARTEALQAAVDDAHGKARILAAAAGTTLGSVLEIREIGGGDGPIPMMSEMRVADVPVSPGEIDTRVDVSVRYALGD